MKKSFLIYLPIDLKTWLKQEAVGKGMTLTGLITMVLNAHRETETAKTARKLNAEKE